MKDYVIDVLMNIGVPAGIKGFTYICDAIELFNTDPYDTLSILHLQKVILIWYPAIWI